MLSFNAGTSSKRGASGDATSADSKKIKMENFIVLSSDEDNLFGCEKRKLKDKKENISFKGNLLHKTFLF